MYKSSIRNKEKKMGLGNPRPEKHIYGENTLQQLDGLAK